MPFIQVTSEAASGPIRHTVSDVGIAEEDELDPPPDPHPAMSPASAAVAVIARADVLNRTAGSPFTGFVPRSLDFRGDGPVSCPTNGLFPRPSASPGRSLGCPPTRVPGRPLGVARRPACGPRNETNRKVSYKIVLWSDRISAIVNKVRVVREGMTWIHVRRRQACYAN